ncbi:protein POOR HOMOLOGOUS SYNAPSIS 1 [Iris pallida]|uniref:Protein POOR HOMOLOGOUS SYNAPSIS 1 n=1 Tax=Iris pallida TaxID=29817 RepID=A0AAX6HXV2_IRIPA|nr:protein POOR HOMOLOGOUS SYNAPSIS 1 [Iris pallida]
MAGAASADPCPTREKAEWEADYSRFFNFPRPSPTATGILHPLPKGKRRSRGTWLSAATPAAVRVARPRSGGGHAVLSVSVLGVVVEEHFVSKLHFSWPQVSCVPQCPVRGIRAVFLSYRNCSGQANSEIRGALPYKLLCRNIHKLCEGMFTRRNGYCTPRM